MDLQVCTIIKNAHTGPINSLKYDSTGEYILTGGSDKHVKLHNTSSENEQKLVKRFEGHGWEVLSVDLAHDNSKFVSAGGDKSVYYWDVVTAQIIKRYSGHSYRITSVAFNDDSSVVASGSFDATVRLWDCKSNNRHPIQVLSDAKDSISSIFIREHWIMTGSLDGRVRTYDLRMGTLTTDVLDKPVTFVSFSGDNNCALVSSLDSCVRLFDVENGELLNCYESHLNLEYQIDSVLDPTDAWIASGSEDGNVYVWDLVDARLVQTLQVATEKPIQSIAWRPKGQCSLATACSDGTIKIWNNVE